MAGYFTTNTLIADVKRRAMVPQNQSTFTTTDFLAFANTELKIGIVPSVLSVHEEYYVYPEVVALTANKSSYNVPYRAIGGKLRDLFYKDANGNLQEMTRISPDDKSYFQESSAGSNYSFYYLEGNNIVLTPNVGASVTGSLVFTYFMRPSDLVEESRVAVITDKTVDTGAGTTTFTVATVPTGMTGNSTLDLLQAKPGHKLRNYDLTPIAVSTSNKTITFTSSEIDSDTEVGDHISFAGECMIPQCPSDLHAVLAQRVATRCLEALGDTQGLTNANTKLQEMEVKTIALIDVRVEGAPQKVVNRRGLLQSGRMRRNRW